MFAFSFSFTFPRCVKSIDSYRKSFERLKSFINHGFMWKPTLDSRQSSYPFSLIWTTTSIKAIHLPLHVSFLFVVIVVSSFTSWHFNFVYFYVTFFFSLSSSHNFLSRHFSFFLRGFITGSFFLFLMSLTQRILIFRFFFRFSLIFFSSFFSFHRLFHCACHQKEELSAKRRKKHANYKLKTPKSCKYKNLNI